MMKRVWLRASMPALLFAIAAALPASAAPTSAQQQAIRSACPSDFRANCSGVSPGGADALQCLEKNLSSLSPACQAAVSAVSPPAPAAAPAPAPAAPAPAAATTPPAAANPPPAAQAAPTSAQQQAIRSACQGDFRANCAGVSPGGAEALQCLQKNVASLSPACQSAVNAVGAASAGATPPPPKKGAAPAAKAVPPPPPAAQMAPPPPPPMTAREEARFVRQSCRGDFRAFCRGITVGEGRAVACLRLNSAALSPTCKYALMTLGR
ncbi:hypothetical protein [Kaistia algarum]|uniref:hypothetical protein n=1 Tax=Kaistia algarum TaxID=2083279 RepID=UPI0022550B39|nr:hypothetical protein [Kaistia algarum]MCX5513264.1 hypothetical protein [Kaistia algarum]